MHYLQGYLRSKTMNEERCIESTWICIIFIFRQRAAKEAYVGEVQQHVGLPTYLK